VRVGDVGGGFGMKAMVPPKIVTAPMPRASSRARCAGAQRGWRSFRPAVTAATNALDAELAFASDGKIVGLRVRLLGNIGAYATAGGPVINLFVGPKWVHGVYHVPAVDLRAQAVLTNTNVVGAYRGAGRPESIFLIERLMDQAAAEMKIDPAELRHRKPDSSDRDAVHKSHGKTSTVVTSRRS